MWILLITYQLSTNSYEVFLTGGMSHWQLIWRQGFLNIIFITRGYEQFISILWTRLP